MGVAHDKHFIQIIKFMNVIQIENLWKQYHLGVIGHGTLTHDLQSWWAKMRGKEDPNSTIDVVRATTEIQEEGERSFWALKGVNINVKEGAVLGIIGKNGAGKSTLLKILSRVTAPTIGNICVRGRIASLLEVGTGFHPELTGRENIFMNGAILGMSKQEVKSKLDEIIAFSGVDKFVDTPVKRYSSGMYVRLAFAVAAHLEPEILVVDEVLAVGDADFQKKCMGKMGEIAEGGRTVLFVSHNMSAIQKICSEAVELVDGKVSNSGNVGEVVSRYLGGKKKTSIVYNNDPSPKEIKIQYVSVSDENGENRYSYNSGEKISIKICFHVFKPARKYNISLEVHHSLYGCVFTSTMSDNDYESVSKRYWEEGRYCTQVFLPTNIMRGGEYSINVAATIPKVFVFDEVLDLCFDIVDVDSPVFLSGEGRRGAVLPLLKWTVKHEDGQRNVLIR